MPDDNTDRWLTLDESIEEDIDGDSKLQARFDLAGTRVNVALQVYQLRNSYKLTRSQFGKIVGMTADQVAKIERVNFTEPPDEIAKCIHERMNQWIERINSVSEPPQELQSSKECRQCHK
jgi:DNA-binding transcriptional regulator YiaG